MDRSALIHPHPSGGEPLRATRERWGASTRATGREGRAGRGGAGGPGWAGWGLAKSGFEFEHRYVSDAIGQVGLERSSLANSSLAAA